MKRNKDTNTIISKPLYTPEISIKDTIGQLDRTLSEMLYLAEGEFLDEVDAQTLKHHAEDLIGVGGKILNVLEGRK